MASAQMQKPRGKEPVKLPSSQYCFRPEKILFLERRVPESEIKKAAGDGNHQQITISVSFHFKSRYEWLLPSSLSGLSDHHPNSDYGTYRARHVARVTLVGSPNRPGRQKPNFQAR